jgi:hypothetical protein
MAEQHGPWPAAGPSQPGWLPPAQVYPPSGLFPASTQPFPLQPPRPRFREPYAIGVGPIFAGLGAGVLWMVMFGALGQDLLTYAWWTLAAAVSAWVIAIVLAYVGDRGVAVGVAVTAGLGWAVAFGFVAARWIGTGDWPMW